jgi:hypothetical protein
MAFDGVKLKKMSATGLRAFAMLLNVGALVSLFLLCMSGTMGTDEENPFIFRSISIASVRYRL